MFIAQPTTRRTYDGPYSSLALPSSVLHATPVPPAPISTSNYMREGISTIIVVLVLGSWRTCKTFTCTLWGHQHLTSRDYRT